MYKFISAYLFHWYATSLHVCDVSTRHASRSSTNANSVMHSLDSLPNCTVFCITCTQPHVMTCSCVLITQTSPIQLALTTSSTFRDANFWTLNTVPRSHGSCISRNKRRYEACPIAGRYDNTGCRGHRGHGKRRRAFRPKTVTCLQCAQALAHTTVSCPIWIFLSSSCTLLQTRSKAQRFRDLGAEKDIWA